MSVEKLVLVDLSLEVCMAWNEAFRGQSDVQVFHARFEQVAAFDCMVSAANAFGLMDGGVDLAIARFFGQGLVARIQERILQEYLGEQPVGTSMIIETGHPRHPYVAHTPTMRVPMSIRSTDHVYTALWAALIAAERHNRTSHSPIRVLACPGLGTATGQVPPEEAARQMALAWKWYRERPVALDWTYARARQREIGRGGD